MRIFTSLLKAGLVLSAATSALAASWTFTDATISVQGRGTGVSSGLKEKLTPNTPLSKPITLDSTSTLKIILTTTENKSPKKPHQAHLLLRDASSNLDISYPLSVKESGKAKVDITLKDLPVQFLRSQSPLTASLVIASFGSSTGYNAAAFTLRATPDSAPVTTTEKPLRYGKLPEIHHVFRADATSPPKVISLVFAAATLTTVPILLGAWLSLGGNLNHLSKALNAAPISHALFVGSIVSIEGVLFLYYTTWNLFQTLPVLAVIGVVALVSGSRALTEVQERRLAGLR